MLALAVSSDQLYPVFLWLCPPGGLLYNPLFPVWAVAQSGRKRTHWGLMSGCVDVALICGDGGIFHESLNAFLCMQACAWMHLYIHAVLSSLNLFLIYMRSLHPVLSITSNTLPLMNADNGEEIDFDIRVLWLDGVVTVSVCGPPVIVYIYSN